MIRLKTIWSCVLLFFALKIRNVYLRNSKKKSSKKIILNLIENVENIYLDDINGKCQK